MDISKKIYTLRTSYNLTQTEFAKIAGVSDKSVSAWENGSRDPKVKPIQRICDHFGIDINAFIDKDNDVYKPDLPTNVIPVENFNKVPLVGQIACGTPILAEQNVEDIVAIPKEWHANFTLKCKGDSMFPTIQDGDLVAIRIQPEVENGEVAAVRIKNEATLKRVYLHDDYIELRPDNHDHPSIIRRKNEMNDVHIEGKAVGLCRGL